MAKPGQTQPPRDRGEIRDDRGGDQGPDVLQAGPVARALVEAGKHQGARESLAGTCVRKKPSGTALHDRHQINSQAKRCRRIVKSASMGAIVIKTAHAIFQVGKMSTHGSSLLDWQIRVSGAACQRSTTSLPGPRREPVLEKPPLMALVTNVLSGLLDPADRHATVALCLDHHGDALGG